MLMKPNSLLRAKTCNSKHKYFSSKLSKFSININFETRWINSEPNLYEKSFLECQNYG